MWFCRFFLSVLFLNVALTWPPSEALAQGARNQIDPLRPRLYVDSIFPSTRVDGTPRLEDPPSYHPFQTSGQFPNFTKWNNSVCVVDANGTNTVVAAYEGHFIEPNVPGVETAAFPFSLFRLEGEDNRLVKTDVVKQYEVVTDGYGLEPGASGVLERVVDNAGHIFACDADGDGNKEIVLGYEEKLPPFYGRYFLEGIDPSTLQQVWKRDITDDIPDNWSHYIVNKLACLEQDLDEDGGSEIVLMRSTTFQSAVISISSGLKKSFDSPSEFFELAEGADLIRISSLLSGVDLNLDGIHDWVFTGVTDVFGQDVMIDGQVHFCAPTHRRSRLLAISGATGERLFDRQYRSGHPGEDINGFLPDRNNDGVPELLVSSNGGIHRSCDDIAAGHDPFTTSEFSMSILSGADLATLDQIPVSFNDLTSQDTIQFHGPNALIQSDYNSDGVVDLVVPVANNHPSAWLAAVSTDDYRPLQYFGNQMRTEQQLAHDEVVGSYYFEYQSLCDLTNDGKPDVVGFGYVADLPDTYSISDIKRGARVDVYPGIGSTSVSCSQPDKFVVNPLSIDTRDRLVAVIDGEFIYQDEERSAISYGSPIKVIVSQCGILQPGLRLVMKFQSSEVELLDDGIAYDDVANDGIYTVPYPFKESLSVDHSLLYGVTFKLFDGDTELSVREELPRGLIVRDEFGFEKVNYQWIGPSDNATIYPVTNENRGEVILFPVLDVPAYKGTLRNNLYVSANGTFSTKPSFEKGRKSWPPILTDEGMVYGAFVAELKVTEDSQIITDDIPSNGVNPRRVVITWRNFIVREGYGPISFQAVIDTDSGEYRFNYQGITGIFGTIDGQEDFSGHVGFLGVRFKYDAYYPPESTTYYPESVLDIGLSSYRLVHKSPWTNKFIEYYGLGSTGVDVVSETLSSLKKALKRASRKLPKRPYVKGLSKKERKKLLKKYRKKKKRILEARAEALELIAFLPESSPEKQSVVDLALKASTKKPKKAHKIFRKIKKKI